MTLDAVHPNLEYIHSHVITSHQSKYYVSYNKDCETNLAKMGLCLAVYFKMSSISFLIYFRSVESNETSLSELPYVSGSYRLT